MSEINLSDAFARYKVKSPKSARSALTADRALVLSCFYTRFHRAEAGVLRYEEDLGTDSGALATQLRTHLSDAMDNELDIKLIIAMASARPAASETVAGAPPHASRMSFHARRDLVGRVTFFDGSRFVIDFRKAAVAA